MTVDDGHPPDLRSSVIGRRSALTLWLPVLLAVASAVWWSAAGPLPAWWAVPALTAACALAGDPVVRAMFAVARDTETARLQRRDLVEDRRPAVPVRAPLSDQDKAEDAALELPGPPLHGGLIVGVLERVATIVCLLHGYAAGLAVIVAVKGLARYGEFSHARQREQFIIGTLTSLLWAAGGAGVILWSTAPA